MGMDYTYKVLFENAVDYKEKNLIRCLENAEKSKMDTVMVSNLYKMAIDKAHVDFDDIPESKGDIEKYKGYSSMISCIDMIKKLSKTQNVRITEIEILEKAISNLKTHKDIYRDGFALKKDFIILQYNCLVMACVQATSCLISSYIDFTKNVDVVEFNLIKLKTKADSHCFGVLEKFNNSCNKGENRKFLTLLFKNKDSFVGADELIIGGMIVGLALSIVPMMRELVFYFYYTRMKVSEYLEMQQMLLDINKNGMESRVANPRQRKDILKKQEEAISKLSKLSEKLKVNHRLAISKSTSEIKSEEKKWTLDNMKKEALKVDSNFTLL